MRGFTTTGRAAMRGASKADAVAKSKPKTQRIRYRDPNLRLGRSSSRNRARAAPRLRRRVPQRPHTKPRWRCARCASMR